MTSDSPPSSSGATSQRPRADLLLVGTVPPPHHGMAIQTEVVFKADWSPLRVERLPMRFSEDLQAVGKAGLGKVFHLVGLIARTWAIKLTRRPRVLYYTAGSANMAPFLRDAAYLICVRWLFRTLLIHYHSGGLPDYLEASRWRRFLGRLAYGRGAWSLALTRHVSVPDEALGAARVIEVPNGLDVPSPAQAATGARGVFRILFLGNLYLDKGPQVAIQAAADLARAGRRVRLTLVGGFPNEETEETLRASVPEDIRSLDVVFTGSLTGAEKWVAFSDADVFIFPTSYHNENFPLVIIEAMAHGLPVVATRWRGIPGLVEDGLTGVLIEKPLAQDATRAMLRLAEDEDLRSRMGEAAALRYRNEFTREAFVSRLRSVFSEACQRRESPTG